MKYTYIENCGQLTTAPTVKSIKKNCTC